ncbi:bifunctional phosphopantothenoylcysteine decarboxylase/phosphopantothenate--cysteine ligase CoaBC [Granulicella sp. 5B5]|uniref:bifunctional phosphopantothenoylcysteine decarboxylase/phosphopantothenate--cysteine ligase CoaBC n=1 Tax=Granulicella sp. 5B5 TaxID=1617967 RepID=UPI0015F61B1C|nr:bifunctional phosphopantothenoylcysteine decarboxylase/phosphopantothenate--cysteine ligase CoaBC [Granulicella sp. 5B5]QMV17347.1 bifunctional phosphopantothenoylcysteine decarboxylase/phosphopantothenate--cysteine ligase CoaBC [Granulicella sp. 5B5]
MRILLGVTGGIAAYKAAELTRELQRRGCDVQIAMTASAERFVTPLTFASLSGHQVLTSLWQPAVSETASDTPAPFDIEHIAVATHIDALIIAPATANTLAKLAHGLADDLLSTIALATKAPVFVAPAMNVNMWHHPATQTNIATLRGRGVTVIEPGSGPLACGMVGEGRLADPIHIADTLINALVARTEPAPHHDLTGETLLITAGGTREPIDPVRFLGNRSSGRMGFALAESALARGAEVILVTAAPAPAHLACEVVSVTTAAEMQSAALAALPRATTVIMAAAVSDYRPTDPAGQKLKKSSSSSETLTLHLTQNDDILQNLVAARRPGTLVLGFAAETQSDPAILRKEARRKLIAKNLDAIIANDVSSPDSGFDVDRNAGILLTHTCETILPTSTKRDMADRILSHLSALRSFTTAHQ